jgi:hypothetical protein
MQIRRRHIKKGSSQNGVKISYLWFQGQGDSSPKMSRPGLLYFSVLFMECMAIVNAVSPDGAIPSASDPIHIQGVSGL